MYYNQAYLQAMVDEQERRVQALRRRSELRRAREGDEADTKDPKPRRRWPIRLRDPLRV